MIGGKIRGLFFATFFVVRWAELVAVDPKPPCYPMWDQNQCEPHIEKKTREERFDDGIEALARKSAIETDAALGWRFIQDVKVYRVEEKEYQP